MAARPPLRWAGCAHFRPWAARVTSAAESPTGGSIHTPGSRYRSANAFPVWQPNTIRHYVLLDGGRNDLFPPREDTYAKMLSTIAEARHTWPKAQIVFIRPRLVANPDDNLGFDDHFIESLKSDPATQGVLFVDPITWLAGTDTSGLLATDGIHPNREGEKQLTAALLKSLSSWLARPVGSGL